VFSIVQNPLRTFPRNIPVDLSFMLQTFYWLLRGNCRILALCMHTIQLLSDFFVHEWAASNRGMCLSIYEQPGEKNMSCVTVDLKKY